MVYMVLSDKVKHGSKSLDPTVAWLKLNSLRSFYTKSKSILFVLSLALQLGCEASASLYLLNLDFETDNTRVYEHI